MKKNEKINKLEKIWKEFEIEEISIKNSEGEKIDNEIYEFVIDDAPGCPYCRNTNTKFNYIKDETNDYFSGEIVANCSCLNCTGIWDVQVLFSFVIDESDELEEKKRKAKSNVPYSYELIGVCIYCNGENVKYDFIKCENWMMNYDCLCEDCGNSWIIWRVYNFIIKNLTIKKK